MEAPQETIRIVAQGTDLTREQAAGAMEGIMNGGPIPVWARRSPSMTH